MAEQAGVDSRIQAAMVDEVLDRGFPGVTVASLAARADCDPQELEHRYSSLEDCLSQTFVAGAERYNEAVFSAYREGPDWRTGLRGAAYASARFIRDNRRFIEFSAVALSRSTEFVQAQRDAVLRQQIELIDAGRQELDDPTSVSRGVAESVIGSIFTVLAKKLVEEPQADPEAFVPELMYIAVRPYLGHEAALEELTIPPPEAGRGQAH